MVVAGTISAEAGSTMIGMLDHNDEIIISDITVTADPSPQEAMNKNTAQTPPVKTSKTVITTKTTVKTQE